MRPDEDFRTWAAQHRPMLVRTATLLTAGDPHTAEDVVQTALTKLYLAWPRLRAADNRTAYARRVLVNAFTDEMRATRRQREHLRPELPDRPVGGGTVGEDTRLVFEALAELPERMRATVVLRYFHDLSVADTARALRCTQGTVKSQTARGLEKLGRRLGPLLHDDDPRPVGASTPAGATTPSVHPVTTLGSLS
ncbi:SigE family RNA polymerase sigma factor [Cellulomonas sp. URHE0023]|uniref:SigE family RNA polymerase sigma factor n=1 Tax=Cellulomonas sp. URHE0023 TaxID=1380354 RepID=UPI00068EF077|nr:SigE family RNA polymerase sigma factor [Cellulomonas sp. URHE0023]